MDKEELEEKVFEMLKDMPGPWRTYANPMRDDGVFLGQDKSHVPYQGVFDMTGNPLYPATPKGAYIFPRQLPLDMAERLVERLNNNIKWIQSADEPCPHCQQIARQNP